MLTPAGDPARPARRGGRPESVRDRRTTPPLRIEQTTVHVASPLALLQMREAFAQLGTFGPLREKDVAVQARLTQLLAEQNGVPLPSRLTPLSL